MKIVVITNCFPPNSIGGAETTAKTIASTFEKNGNEVTYLTISTNKTVEFNSGNVISVPLFNIYDPWRDDSKSIVGKIVWKVLDYFNPVMGFRVYKLLSRIQPDVVFTHNIKGFSVSAWFAARAAGAKLVHVFHDYYLICSRCSLERAGRRCEKQCSSCRAYSTSKSFSSRLVNHFVGVGKFVAEAHEKYLAIDKSRISVINNARAPSSNGLFGSNPEARKKNSSGRIVFGFIGRIEFVKGIDLLFEAFGKLGAMGKGFHLKIAGKEEVPGYLDSLSKKYNFYDFEYLGYSDSKVFYRNVDCVIVPSLWDEPHPGVTYEPMEFGVPVIGANVGGVPDVITHEVNGLMFKPGDCSDLINCVLRAAEPDVLDKLSEGCLSAERFFDLSRLESQYSSVVDKL